jgi:hypothetical protein
MFKKSAAPAAGGYTIAKSLRFRSSASAYLNRTPGSASNRKTWTWSGWVKLGNFSSALTLFSCGNSGTNLSTGVQFSGGTTNSINVYDFTSGYNWVVTTNAVYRDPSAWYHVVIAFDTTQATAANRVLVYINGSLASIASGATYPTQNTDYQVNNNVPQYIGRFSQSGAVYYDGYLTEINFVDGQALTPSSFGSFSGTGGVWQPIKYTGTYGTNGFYLKFTDTTSTTTLCYDYSGNGNNWTPNNISLTGGTTYDSMTDVPTLTSSTVANYCVMNAISTGVDATITNANLQIAYGTAVTRTGTAGTMGMSSGKWYWEVVVGTVSGSTSSSLLGITSKSSQNEIGNASSYNYTYYGGGTKIIAGVETSYGATYTTSDTIGIAFDADAGSLVFYKNNTSQGTAATGLTSGPYYPLVEDGSGGSSFTVFMNFGQQPFTYTPPTGYVALNTYNLSTPTIAAGNQYMDATLYTGNGSTQTITNAGSFKPDFVWVKSRSAATNHKLTDSVRGATKAFINNNSDPQTTDANGVTAFNSNGFSLGSDSVYNTNASTYVGWQWQSGQGTITTNTTGNVTSNVCVSTTAKFSVLTFTTQSVGTSGTVGHGLGVKPDMILYRHLNEAADTIVYHSSIGATKYLDLSDTIAASTNANVWANTEPTSSVFTLGTSPSGAKPTVAYCWAAVAGFSAFGSYTGNGSTDGSFIYTGFRPKFMLVKRTDTAGYGWHLLDSSRDPYNVAGNVLIPNTSNAESNDPGNYGTDFVANGFKFRTAAGGVNGSGATYIYIAYAENPFKYALAR